MSSLHKLLLPVVASLTLATLPESSAREEATGTFTVVMHSHPGIPPGYMYMGSFTDGGVVKCMFENLAGERIIEDCPF